MSGSPNEASPNLASMSVSATRPSATPLTTDKNGPESIKRNKRDFDSWYNIYNGILGIYVLCTLSCVSAICIQVLYKTGPDKQKTQIAIIAAVSMSAAILYCAMIAVHSIALKKVRGRHDLNARGIRVQCRDVFANIVYNPIQTSRYIILAPLVFTAAFIFVHSVTFYANKHDSEKQFAVSAMSLLAMIPALCFTMLRIGKRPLEQKSINPRFSVMKVVTLFLIYLSIQIAYFVSNEKQPCMITSGMIWLIVIVAIVATYILERRRPPKPSLPQSFKLRGSNQVELGSRTRNVGKRFGS